MTGPQVNPPIDYSLSELREFLARAQLFRREGISAPAIELTMRNHTQGSIPSLTWLRDRIVSLERAGDTTRATAAQGGAPDVSATRQEYTPEQQYRDLTMLRHNPTMARELRGRGVPVAEAMAARGRAADVGTGEALALGAAQGLSMGLTPAIQRLVFGKETGDVVQSRINAVQQHKPGAYIAGAVGATAPEYMAGGLALRGMSAVSRVLMGGLMGGVPAAVAGAAGAPQTIGPPDVEGGTPSVRPPSLLGRAIGAGAGFTLGFPLGAVGEAVAPALGLMGRAVKNRGLTAAQRGGVSIMERAPAGDVAQAGNLMEAMRDEAARTGSTFQPVLGDALVDPLHASVVASPAARRAASAALSGRVSQAGPDLATAIQGTGAGGPRASVAQAEAAARTTRTAVGRSAYNALGQIRTGAVITDEAMEAIGSQLGTGNINFNLAVKRNLATMLPPSTEQGQAAVNLLRRVVGTGQEASKFFGEVWQRAQRLADVGHYRLKPVIEVDADGIPVITGEVPDFKTMQYFQRALRGSVQSGYRAGGTEAAIAAETQPWLRILDEGMPEVWGDNFTQANQIWRAHSDAVEAPVLAKKLVAGRGTDVLDARQWLEEASPQGQQAFKRVARDELIRQVERPSRRFDGVAFLERVGEDRLNLIFTPEEVDKLMERATFGADRRSLAVAMGGRMSPAGSPTMEKAKLLESYGMSGDRVIPVGRPIYAIPRFLANELNIRAPIVGNAMRTNEGAPWLAGQLTNADPAAQAQFLDLLRSQRPTTRGLLAQQIPFGLLGGAASPATGLLMGGIGRRSR